MAQAQIDTTLTIDGQVYNLARDPKTGIEQWSWDPVPDSRASRNEIDAEFGQTPPELLIPKVFRSGHAGYGHAVNRYPDTYHWSKNGDASHPDMLIRSPQINTIRFDNLSPGPGQANGTINGFFEQGGSLFVLVGQYCMKVTTAATPVVTIDKNFGTGVTASPMPVVYLGSAYVGIGASGAFWQRASNGTWTQQSTGGVVNSYGFLAMEDDLWRVATTTSVSVAAARATPMTFGNWATVISVGDDQSAITSLTGLGQILFVGKTDGLYNVDSIGTSINLLPQIGTLRNSRNCVSVANYGTDLLVPHIRGMMQYSVPTGSYVEIQPGYLGSNESAARGQVTAVAVDGFWAYAAVKNHDDETWIFKGRPRQEGDQVPGHFIWHPWLYLGEVSCDALWVSGLWTNPRLFFGLSTDASDSLGYVVLPRDADTNPLYDASTTMGQEAVFYLSATDFGSPGTDKVIASVDVLGDNLSATDYVDVEIRADQGSWQAVGRASEEGVQEIIPADPISGERFETRLTMQCEQSVASDTGGILRKVVLHAIERPPILGVFSATVILADDSIRKDGQSMQADLSTLLNYLETLATTKRPVYLIDPLKRHLWGFILGRTPYRPVAQQGQRPTEIALSFQFAVRAILGGVGKYGYARYGQARYGATDIFTGEYGAARYGRDRYA